MFFTYPVINNVNYNQNRFHILLITVLVCACLSLSSCAGIPEYPAKGDLAGQEVKTTVDSEIARYYLETYRRGDRSDLQHDREIERAHETWDKHPLDGDSLRRLSEQFSPDFATLYFVNRVYQGSHNRKAQQAFRSHLAAIRTTGVEEGFRVDERPRPYLFAFVPGYAYKREPATGADFARQRRLMDRAGFKTALIETDELGTVEKNAAIIAGELMRLSKQYDRIILVSTSKGGAEAALALGKLLTPEQSRAVKAWISVGGILRGSPLADRALVWPRSWWTKVVVFFLGFQQEIVENLSTRKRKEVFEQLAFPDHMLMVQYVGVPLSGQVSPDVRGRYRRLRMLGPNDGLTLLPDEVVPAGIVITDMGLDHYYRDPEIDLKTFALAHVVLTILEEKHAAVPPGHQVMTQEQRAVRLFCVHLRPVN